MISRKTPIERGMLATLAVLGLGGCYGKIEAVPEDEQAQADMANYRIHTSSAQSRGETDQRLKQFSMALARAVTDPMVGHSLHQQLARKFDGDVDLLWSDFKSQRLDAEPMRERLMALLPAETLAQAERVPFLNVAMPVNFDKWDGHRPVLVAYVPTTVDDDELKTIEAYDADGRVHLLDAWKEPADPVLVVGINERMDPDTGKLHPEYAPGLKGSDPGEVSVQRQAQMMVGGYPDFFLQWLYLFNDHEPWAKGSAEILVSILVDSGKKVGPLRFTEKNDGNYYNLNSLLFKYAQDLTRYVAVRLDEDDGGPKIDVEVGLSNKKKVPLLGELAIDIKTKFSIHDSDDYIGSNELIDLKPGPRLGSIGAHPGSTSNMERVGDGAVTFWWRRVSDASISRDQMLPFNDQNTIIGKSHDWEITGEPDNADFAYMLDIGKSIKVDITTCHEGTDFDTLIELFDVNGPMGLMNDQDPSCPSSENKSTLKGVYLNPGIYWLVVDGWNGQEGNFHLTISPSP
jgi:hypothetical protein